MSEPNLRSDQAMLKALNDVRRILQTSNKYVDEYGRGVFTLRDLLEPLGLYDNRHILAIHLSNMGVLVKGDMQPDRRFVWRVDMTKKAITIIDLRKSRERQFNRKQAQTNTRTAKLSKSKTPQSNAAQPVGKVVSIPVEVVASPPEPPSDPLGQVAAQMQHDRATITRLEAENAQLVEDIAQLQEDKGRLTSELAVWREGVEDLRRQIRDIDTTLDQLPHQ